MCIRDRSTDYEGDGCRDASIEDNDDDNDGIEDELDDCSRGILSWISDSVNDYDQDGCQDASEDEDDDGDLIKDQFDSCPLGKSDWISEPLLDSDADGCHDTTEDDDYEPYVPEETEEDNALGPTCNPFLEICEEEEGEDSISTADEQSETQVRQLLMTILALAIIPTVIGVLILAYRMKW